MVRCYSPFLYPAILLDFLLLLPSPLLLFFSLSSFLYRLLCLCTSCFLCFFLPFFSFFFFFFFTFYFIYTLIFSHLISFSSLFSLLVSLLCPLVSIILTSFGFHHSSSLFFHHYLILFISFGLSRLAHILF